MRQHAGVSRAAARAPGSELARVRFVVRATHMRREVHGQLDRVAEGGVVRRRGREEQRGEQHDVEQETRRMCDVRSNRGLRLTHSPSDDHFVWWEHHCSIRLIVISPWLRPAFAHGMAHASRQQRVTLLVAPNKDESFAPISERISCESTTTALAQALTYPPTPIMIITALGDVAARRHTITLHSAALAAGCARQCQYGDHRRPRPTRKRRA